MARGQTETLGMVLLLAITIAGVSVVVVAAGGALEDAQQTSAVERAEQSMSLLDARGSLVALGRTDGQSVSLADSADGEYAVRPDTGRMVVTQDGENGGSEEYLNTTLGSVVYENGGTEVAYQGGGVWRSSGAGAEMVSPPEFNYRGATLTLPVIRVAGDAADASGSPTARLSPDEVGTPVFPNENNSNPLTGGNVTVTVYSEYYRGWEAYFEERTTGDVTVYPEESRVDLRLIARNSGGAFTLQETPIDVRGLSEEDPIQSLSFSLKQSNSKFASLDWSLVADNGGGREVSVNVQSKGQLCNGGGGEDISVEITVSDDGEILHRWTNESAFEGTDSAFTLDCDDTSTIHLDLISQTEFRYPDGDSPLSNNSVGYIVNHYLSEMSPNLEFDSRRSNNAGVDADDSTGEMGYNASSSRVVTFLHVTENSMNVTVS